MRNLGETGVRWVMELYGTVTGENQTSEYNDISVITPVTSNMKPHEQSYIIIILL